MKMNRWLFIACFATVSSFLGSESYAAEAAPLPIAHEAGNESESLNANENLGIDTGYKQRSMTLANSDDSAIFRIVFDFYGFIRDVPIRLQHIVRAFFSQVKTIDPDLTFIDFNPYKNLYYMHALEDYKEYEGAKLNKLYVNARQAGSGVVYSRTMKNITERAWRLIRLAIEKDTNRENEMLAPLFAIEESILSHINNFKLDLHGPEYKLSLWGIDDVDFNIHNFNTMIFDIQDFVVCKHSYLSLTKDKNSKLLNDMVDRIITGLKRLDSMQYPRTKPIVKRLQQYIKGRIILQNGEDVMQALEDSKGQFAQALKAQYNDVQNIVIDQVDEGHYIVRTREQKERDEKEERIRRDQEEREEVERVVRNIEREEIEGAVRKIEREEERRAEEARIRRREADRITRREAERIKRREEERKQAFNDFMSGVAQWVVGKAKRSTEKNKKSPKFEHADAWK